MGRGNLLISVAAVALIASPALAQTQVPAQTTSATPANNDTTAATPQNAETAESQAVGDIIVTAQKRSQRLQDVPLTIQAFGADTIENRRIDTLASLTSVAPSVQISGFSAVKPVLYIRGIGTRQLGPSIDQSVGIFIDDFYAGDSSALSQGLADIERIEVLKGPQGTLYGRNTIAGAISITTKAPSTDTEGVVEGSIGNYNYINVKGSVSGPIVDNKLLGRLSFYTSKRDPYVRNTLTGGGGLGLDQAGLRGKLLFNLTESLTATLTADYNKDTSPGQLGERRTEGTFLKRASVANPPVDNKPFQTQANVDPTVNSVNYGGNLRVQWEGEDLTIASLTQYRRGHFHAVTELDATPLDIIVQDGRQRSRNFSQEIRLTSDPSGALSLGGKLDWILGLFYYDSRASAVDQFTLGVDSIGNQLAGRNTRSVESSSLTTRSIAAYADLTYHVTSQLELTLGLRYSNDHKDGTQSGSTDTPGFPIVVAPFSVPVRFRGDSLDPKATITWKPTRDVTAYATYSSGYKSGGFQYLASIAAVGGSVFGPERVDSYEAGLKTQWFDRRLTLNVAGFYGQYKGLQLTRVLILPTGASTNITDNAATVNLRGIETEFRAAITDRFSIDGSYAYLNNKFGKYNQCAAVVTTGCAILDGTRLPRSPKHQIILGGQYVVPIGSDELTLRADWTHRSRSILEAGGDGAVLPATGPVATLNPFFREPSNDVVDLRMSYRRDRWTFSIWGTNITNEAYTLAFANLPPEFLSVYAPPRMYGATVKLAF